MKTSTYKNMQLALGLISLILIVLATVATITYEGFLQHDPVKMVAAPLVVFSALVAFAIKWAINLWNNIQIKRAQELFDSGIYAFIDSASQLEDLRNMIRNAKSVEDAMMAIDRFARQYPREKEVRGVVCGEEIVGVAEGIMLAVTVTKPETIRMFRRLPKHFKQYITVVEAPDDSTG